MSKVDIKSEIVLLLNRAKLNSPGSISDLRFHPIRKIDAIKSLIGINLENVNLQLLDLAKSYAQDTKDPLVKSSNEDYKPKEVISFIDLEIALMKKNNLVAQEAIQDLLHVADKKQIIEFLIEYSLKQTGESFLFIWSIYKILLFIDFKDSIDWFYLAITAICLDIESNIENIKTNIDYGEIFTIRNISDFDLLSKLYQLSKSSFVREDRMKNSITNLISTRVIPSVKVCYDTTLIDDDQKLYKRQWISDYLRFKDKNISVQDIITLDSARGILYLDENDELYCYIFSYINNCIVE